MDNPFIFPTTNTCELFVVHKDIKCSIFAYVTTPEVWLWCQL